MVIMFSILIRRIDRGCAGVLKDNSITVTTPIFQAH